MFLLLCIGFVFSVFASCSFHLPDSVLGTVEARVPFCRSCRRHRVLDVVFLLDSNAANFSGSMRQLLSRAVENSIQSKLLSPFGDGLSPETILRYAVVTYGSKENQLKLSLVQDFTVNQSSTSQALGHLQPQSEKLFDNVTAFSKSALLLEAMQFALSRKHTPLNFFQPLPKSQLLPVSLFVVEDPGIERGGQKGPINHEDTLKAVAAHGKSAIVRLTLLSNGSSALGHASAEDRYGDYSGFNREQTLKKLQAMGADRSLQYSILSAGYQVRVFDQQALLDAKGDEVLRQVLHSTPEYYSYEDLHCCSMSPTAPLHVGEPVACEETAECSVVLPSCFQGEVVPSNDGSGGNEGANIGLDIDNAVTCDATAAMTDTAERCVSENPEEGDTTANGNFFVQTDPQERDFTEDNLIKIRLEPELWEPTKPFTEFLALRGKPTILRQAQPSGWTALHRWTGAYFSRYSSNSTFADVKIAPRSNGVDHKFYDADEKAALKDSVVDFRLPYSTTNMNVSEFFRVFQDDNASEMAYYFAPIPPEFKKDVLPDNLMFLAPSDSLLQMKYLWMSSSGVHLHTHFDQDHNYFVQVSGRKRFIMFPPAEMDKLYPFPRTHPLWHKAQTDFFHPNLTAFPAYRLARAWEAVLEPGDLLYVPPYWWHFVTALTPSISISTWSKQENVEQCMNYVYSHEHKFDMLSHPKGRLYALRLYLDMMVEAIYGPGQSPHFFRRLLETRYATLSSKFPAVSVCSSKSIPVARHVFGDTSLDAALGQKKFALLQPEIRDMIFIDYCEELVSNVLTANLSYSFFKQCFLSQGYDFVSHDDDGLYLWEYK